MELRDAERLLLSLELFGMRFGLDRMRRLLTALGSPQERFGAVHVVGTNGKSSTVRMTAAILRRHGLRTGAYLSPHLVSFAERVRVDDQDVTGAEFVAAVSRAAAAADKVNRTAPPDDHVTQFELLTAAAFDHFARAECDVAVVEAGLGGRYDATNVLQSRVSVLTNVGLEHTRWLGPTIAAIATEKLDVLEPGSTLVIGSGLHPDARVLAEQIARERGATLVEAPADPGNGLEILARGAFQRRNFAEATESARAYLKTLGRRLDPEAVIAAAASTLVPGRFEVIAQRPDTVLDGAHNPGGLEALAEALPEFVAGRRLVACLAVLDDKDATAMLRVLLPHCDAVVTTRAQTPRALPPATLASLCHQLDFGGDVEIVGEAHAALERARTLAGPDGVALATGSIYLIADLLRPAGAARSTL
ncbi:MAG TPA: folylpolyglutamate synthase/dihydrofolate synthase family protein [Baekduia sp.]|uniref:bifunctional folylpolyglutamate synthase/dihydrofolate synthase n=1 Tax=Baekduia sp. TaxID=2600305 RepID=UPI002D797148|nr:folylpolyglutamate synthase/dihydrofolate synthase family protein [Baekduia sp.]HET6508195.1 folylpolyglutamate synthase/dihydrofolate synthase family protein [Baekduia sp.]